VLQLRILHVAAATDWAAALRTGRYEISSRGTTLADEGFVHASTASQVGGVLGRYYADLDPATLRLLVLDVDLLAAAGSPVRWDPVPGAADPYPHVYGPLVPSAVVAVLPLGGGPGDAQLPDLTGWDVAG
jgi:uncharacterized protein (DUF952 family)